MSISALDHDPLVAEHHREWDEVGDDVLLQRFVLNRDEAAFALLVTRHASLVMGVCRRILMHQQDAEDAFQATFLVLARKARAVKRAKSLPAWLHKTAHRLALRSRWNRSRRHEETLETGAMVEAHPSLQKIATDYERSALDEELNRLPERYRLPLFLCCIEGKSREEAARQLGWSSGSLKGRLERARQLLRHRLILRGVSVGVAMALVLPTQSTAQAAVAHAIIVSTVQAGLRYAAHQSPLGYVSGQAHYLANGSLTMMALGKFKIIVYSFLAIGLLATGGSWISIPAVAEGGVDTIVVESASSSTASTSFVALLDAEREVPRPERDPNQAPPRAREKERREGERREGERREGDRERREADRPEGDRPRRDVERPDRERPREGEGVDRERERPREGDRPRPEFRPRNEQEEALFHMILQLQREVAHLRNELQRRDGPPPHRDGAGPFLPRREGDQPRRGDAEPRREVDQPRREVDQPRRDGDARRDPPPPRRPDAPPREPESDRTPE